MIECIPINEWVVERVNVTRRCHVASCRHGLLTLDADSWDGGSASIALHRRAVVTRSHSPATVLQWEIEVLNFDVVKVEVAIGFVI